jgi:hypothetical protein
MMAIVHFVGETVQRRQCQLVDLVDAILVIIPGWNQSQPRPQVQQDVGSLADEEVSVFEGWRGEDGRVDAVVRCLARDMWHHLLHAVLDLCRIRVLGPGLFKSQTDKLASAGYARPVKEIVRYILGRLLTFAS